MALGSVWRGQVASWMGIPFALTAAAVGMVAAVALTRGLGLGEGHARDFRPSLAWTPPVLVEPAQPDRSTMVTIEDRVQNDGRADFVAAMREVRAIRRRNGAYFWQLNHHS